MMVRWRNTCKVEWSKLESKSVHDSNPLIKAVENQVEKALWDLELHDQLDQALQVYLRAQQKLEALAIMPGDPDYPDQQRVLSYCLMRRGNILRQLGKPQEALALSEHEIAAARASGDELTLARAVMSNGTNLIVAGQVEPGLKLLEEGRQLFEKSEAIEFRQGLGWYWILQADLTHAGLVKMEPGEVIAIATRALEILLPIENWPGVARAYAARAKAYDQLGETHQAADDRAAQQAYESKTSAEENYD